jgi:superfamily II DNA or RNA helicase
MCPAAPEPGALLDDSFVLKVTFEVAAGAICFEWAQASAPEKLTKLSLVPVNQKFRFFNAVLDLVDGNLTIVDTCNVWPASIRALFKRIRNLRSVATDALQIGLLTETDLGMAKAGRWFPIQLPPDTDPWKWLERQIVQFAKLCESSFGAGRASFEVGPFCLYLLACALLEITPAATPDAAKKPNRNAPLYDLSVTFDGGAGFAEFVWFDPILNSTVAIGRVRCTSREQVRWELEKSGQITATVTSREDALIRAAVNRWIHAFPTALPTFKGFTVTLTGKSANPVRKQIGALDSAPSIHSWIHRNLVLMIDEERLKFSSTEARVGGFENFAQSELENYEHRLLRQRKKREEEEAQRRETLAHLAEQRRQRELKKEEALKLERARLAKEAAATAKTQSFNSKTPAKERAPLPPVPIRFEMPALSFQETVFPITDLNGYFLRERAALWWVSNQSDDLLCLSYCRVERLEYQIRTALRVLGPLRGRALLSDEVGLGKTIESGLVIKELFTRGMVKRFLVLTVPSLVDQWQEELSDKFGLETVTTNDADARGDAQQFWNENTGIVASLHTLKQPAQLEIARKIQWDILVVDEAHYLRNRESQAWQAVNVLPRQFMLLLTATPVQNSLEELYNLVTLLQPGQLPTPKEFRARFIDPKRPRQPREPEELRRLLGQVMIRNTRANSGIQLPPRRAETIFFEPDEAERLFWKAWEDEFRARLATFNPSQSSLWGRLLLQTAASSPAAWRAALEKFPDAKAARAWRDQSPLETSWRRKAELILPLTRGEGGVVIFTQFLQTQAAMADFLRGAGVETFVIHGSIPAAERQPITEQFRKQGGALLLTHSGTEGRNLQFCHRLINFDLPWNPMEIEQRIGRLHRIGQRQPVRIYNFVQTGTLAEHLLQILQEKLNLFELVVGETGLVLGERFSSDEFAEEVFHRWRDSEGRVAEALAGLGDELAAARNAYGEVKELDETLFAKDYESL